MTIMIESEEFWRQHIEKFKLSGLSRARYCKETGIVYHRFGHWLKKVCPIQSAFIPIKIQSSKINSGCAALCTLELQNFVIKIHDISVLSFILDRVS